MKEFCIAIPYQVNEQLRRHLIIGDEQEEVAFAFWYPSIGLGRFTALIHSIEFPHGEEDRILQGNVLIKSEYFKRVCRIAMEKKSGIAMLHSHPGNGWQSMSADDIKAEMKFAAPADDLTEMPFVGLTAGQDGVWSGRQWIYSEQSKQYKRQWANNIRVYGEKFEIHHNDRIQSPVKYRENFKRTITVWGKENHRKLARLQIGIIGVGSVGSIVAESLARMGMQQITLIDHDLIEKHNLDRTLGATASDIGQFKVDVISRSIKQSATAHKLDVNPVPFSIANEKGYREALNCDILFSCVDKPRPRYILNHLAYNHLIPVIDGGIQVRFNDYKQFAGAEWQLQTVGPDRPCLECLESYTQWEVDLEINGLLENPSYIKGLPEEYRKRKNNENIFPFSTNLASMEIFHLMALVTEIGETPNFGVQRFRFNNGIISNYNQKKCCDSCSFVKDIAKGDTALLVYDLPR
jgi:molybdopterin-synthase adenylyltransferase